MWHLLLHVDGVRVFRVNRSAGRVVVVFHAFVRLILVVYVPRRRYRSCKTWPHVTRRCLSRATRNFVQVPANERYELEAMPVPVVMVALEGGDGGRVIESKTDREIKACEGGVFFLPAFTPVQVRNTLHAGDHTRLCCVFASCGFYVFLR